MFTQKSLLIIGWSLILLILILLVVNVINDIRLYGRPSILTVAFTITFVGGMLYSKVRGYPIVTTEGWQGRIWISIVGLISFILVAIAVIFKTG